MRYKDENLMTPFAKALILMLVLAMMSLTVSTASAAIIVDGNVGDWTNGLIVTDPTGDPAINGYDLTALYMEYDAGTNIMYFRLDVDGMPADLDGDGNTGIDCNIPPGDCPGVGAFEQYNVVISGGGPGAVLTYTNNAVSHPDGNAAHGTAVEFSLNNADTYVNPDEFCISVTAGGSADLPGEDTLSECISTPQEVSGDEFWATEWFQTYPDQYTQFDLPNDQRYLTTLSWFAPKSSIHLWGEDVNTPLDAWKGERVKFIHGPDDEYTRYDCYNSDIADERCNNDDMNDDLYLNSEEETVRVHGYFGEGPGDHTVLDPIRSVNQLPPENKPYTDPIGITYPQSDQAPMNDHITFNPAYMARDESGPTWGRHATDILEDDHRKWYDYSWYGKLDFGGLINNPSEKVFKRLSYEKDWFKDHNTNGCFDVVMSKYSEGWNPSDSWRDPPMQQVVCLENEAEIHGLIKDGWEMDIYNNEGIVNSSKADIYGPAIIEDFTYMFLSDDLPTPIQNGSTVFIPMASHDSHDRDYTVEYDGKGDHGGDGIDSFAPNSGHTKGWTDVDGNSRKRLINKGVLVESEETLGLDIDGDGDMDPMDPDGKALSGDENVVLVLKNEYLVEDETLQFFDHLVTLDTVFDDGSAIFDIANNEGSGYSGETPNLAVAKDEVVYFYRGKVGGSNTEGTVFYLKLISGDSAGNEVTIDVGRLFGHTWANIADNKYHSQKVFWVDGVMYNTVAIKAYVDNEIKYITFRQKLPKMDITVHGATMTTWDTYETLPEMPPFNMPHVVHNDIQKEWTHDAIGDIYYALPSNIEYTDERDDERFRGELKEIYNENGDVESWMTEWFNTMPWQYTEFHIEDTYKYTWKDELWLFTGAFVAPESTIHMWDRDTPMFTKTGERVKFWFDDSYDPLYIDDGELKVYGTFGEGPGDHAVLDPIRSVDQLPPENKPYTDPMGPFYPQSEQAPKKDHVTFDAAYMARDEGGPTWGRHADIPEADHRRWYDYSWYGKLDFGTLNYPSEKVFKRMSYEKDWFKDHNTNGCFDVIMSKYSDGWNPSDSWRDPPMQQVVCLDNEDEIHDLMKDGWEMDIHNNAGTVNSSKADIYGPAIIEDFTYMFLSDDLPTPIQSGSTVFIPMASHDGYDRDYTVEYDGKGDYGGDGIDSFAPNSGHTKGWTDVDGSSRKRLINKGVLVESEETLGLDIDGDGDMDPMDPDGNALSGDESVVLVLKNEYLSEHETLQFFDHLVTLTSVFDGGSAIFDIENNERSGYGGETLNLAVEKDEVVYFYRGKEGGSLTEGTTFYLKLVAVDSAGDKAIIEVGRLFGHTWANIADNKYHSQKVFWVDGVMYNTVAIKAYVDNEIKYITFRQKLPKMDITVHGATTTTWDKYETLPEMPPFNMPHVIHDDVQYTQGHDLIGEKMYVKELEIEYTEETTEPRYHGEIKEVYWETGNGGGVTPESPCTAMDLNSDGFVNFDDVLIMVDHWAQDWPPGDFTGDNIVNFDDVLEMLPLWGTCI